MKREITCPECHCVLEINNKFSRYLLVSLVSLSVGLIASIIFAASQMRNTKTARNAINEMAAFFETRSNGIVRVEKDILETKANLEAELKGFVLKEELRLQEKYPSLKRCVSSRIDFSVKYVRYVEWNPSGTIKIGIENNGTRDIDGNFKVYFLNAEGFVTADHHDEWSWTKVKSGETRISEKKVSFRFGQPVYCFVETE
jgi:hypothetical protein